MDAISTKPTDDAAASPGPDAWQARRTFAIISHPDAGKTTLTEHLLLLGGAINLAGEVKARGDRRRARSDWMRIEQERGISVATSVMTFSYGGFVFNLLDTPGHEDFSEDTYRTLTAVDAAVMVLDAARGIEPQTRKLFEVCRLRDIPILTFVNKLDREGQSPFALLDEVEQTLALDVAPMCWPIGMGRNFRGTYDIDRQCLRLLGRDPIETSGLADPAIDRELAAPDAAQLRDDVELVRAAYPAFDLDSFRAGHTTPVFFGSALHNFGVQELLEGIGRLAPAPGARAADERQILPAEEPVTGFIFKIQANTDPNHRDRVGFLRICSGRLRRGMRLKQVRTGKLISVHSPLFFFARDRSIAEEAWPGDIVGIPNHGTLRIGDTLTEGEDLHIAGVPSFAPELIRRMRFEDAMQAKKLRRALEQLADEGVVQIFRPLDGSPHLVGVVGALQLDVLASRLQTEYGVAAGFEAAPCVTVRWVSSDDAAELDRFTKSHASALAADHDGALVFLPVSPWDLKNTRLSWPRIDFADVREQKWQKA